MVFPSTVVMVSSYDITSPSPVWSYIATAVGIFFYQTLDELDGKQARRTGSSTSLGELFDHGCDAISTFVTVAGCLCVCQTGYTTGAYSAYVFSLMAFQGAHIMTYYKGYLLFGLIDVAEAQVSHTSSPPPPPHLPHLLSSPTSSPRNMRPHPSPG